MEKILVTGGCGYIGGHTMVDLFDAGFEVISIDNFSRGYPEMLEGVREITGKKVKNYTADLCHLEEVEAVFEENRDIVGVIHFAALKSVPESTDRPLMYYHNNLMSLINILQCCKEYNVKNFVFSSSCSVYGNAETLPVTEATPLQPAESPYAQTKVMGEHICRDFAAIIPGFNCILLRYFNPVGAHESGLIGEFNEQPENLVPIITQTAAGKRPMMTVYGSDYDTKDGSCVRDYIHVSDIAHAHTLALQKALKEVQGSVSLYNLGTGNGVTVLELIKAFEEAAGLRLNYELGERRPGDVVKVYADRSLSERELGWIPKLGIDDMMRTAWQWQLTLDKHYDAAENKSSF